MGFRYRLLGAVTWCSFAAGIAFAQGDALTPEAKQWHELSDKKQTAAAKKLCLGWESSGTHAQQVEAEKCLANLALAEGKAVQLKGNDVGGGTLGDGFKPEAVNVALVHLNKGIALEPKDLTLHKGRLFLLGLSGRYAEMAAALEDTLNKLPEPEYLPDWLRYTAQLGASGDAQGGLKLLAVLDKHFPNSHEIIGNTGTMYDIQGLWPQGIPYLKRAAELAPKDPIDTWNLGWAYAHVHEPKLADEWMQRSIALPNDDGTDQRKCLYARFVGSELKQKARACTLESQSCARPLRVDCAAATPAHKAK
ncbi:tetratricopeptide repeat protein [Granulicella cerasi]|uniref:Tetratricopeptide repeat protein n=1 Tax=Granulicella cerasi TaxID=741063 RepID=A0ABW1Z9P9_9BACT|nr:hypothetical protein [Granulicella cerasi]